MYACQPNTFISFNSFREKFLFLLTLSNFSSAMASAEIKTISYNY